MQLQVGQAKLTVLQGDGKPVPVAEETTTLLLTDPAPLLEGEPGILTRPVPEQDEGKVGPLGSQPG